MSNKLRNIFSSDPNVASDGIKQMINTAYDKQWCTTCKHSYFLDGDRDLEIRCQISENLCRERRWSSVDNSEQYCLFYETKSKGE